MVVADLLAANIAADIQTWTRLIGLHDQPDLVETETLHYRLPHLPAIRQSAGDNQQP